jgi:hypothetical protein
MQNYAPTVKQAAKMVGVSERSVHQFREVKKKAPKKLDKIRSGELAPSKAVGELETKKAPSKKREPKEEQPFKDQVYAKWTQWVIRFGDRQDEVKKLVHRWTEPRKKGGDN